METAARSRWRLPAALRWGGRGLFIALALFWLWFMVGSFIYELQQGIAGATIHVFQAAVLVLSTVVVFTLELAGGLLLVALAVATWVQWGRHNIFVCLIMCLPLLLSGLLLIAAWAAQRRPAQRRVSGTMK